MTNRRFPYKRPDGGVDIIVPAKESRRPGEGEDEWLARVVDSAIKKAEAVLGPVARLPECDVSQLPPRKDRNAWESDRGGRIVVNPAKAQAANAALTQEEQMADLKARLVKLEKGGVKP